jgi:hypothetical protein
MAAAAEAATTITRSNRFPFIGGHYAHWRTVFKGNEMSGERSRQSGTHLRMGVRKNPAMNSISAIGKFLS